MSNDLLKQVLELPPVERLALVEEIWGSLNTLAEPVSAEMQSMLEERLATDKREPGKVRSWSETKRIATEAFEKRRTAKKSK